MAGTLHPVLLILNTCRAGRLCITRYAPDSREGGGNLKPGFRTQGDSGKYPRAAPRWPHPHGVPPPLPGLPRWPPHTSTPGSASQPTRHRAAPLKIVSFTL